MPLIRRIGDLQQNYLQAVEALVDTKREALEAEPDLGLPQPLFQLSDAPEKGQN